MASGVKLVWPLRMPKRLVSFLRTGTKLVLTTQLSKASVWCQTPTTAFLVVHVDVTDAESVQAMVDGTVKEFGKNDYSISCAGVKSLC